MGKLVDITGKRFGRLVAIRRVGTTNDGKAKWLFECDCGNTAIISGKDVREEKTRSCGCYNIEKSTERAIEIGHSQCGDKHPNWRGGVPQSRDKNALADFRVAVFKRDNYTCSICGARGVILNAHHIYSYVDHVDGRFDIDNGITLCEACHKKFHHLYGYGHNDAAQLNEFIETIEF